MSKRDWPAVLRTMVSSDTYKTAKIAAAPLLVSSVVHDPGSGQVTIFALNRSMEDEMELTAELRGLGERHDGDLKAVNSKDQPDRIRPLQLENVRVEGSKLTARLKPLSWNLFVTEAA